MNMENEKQKRRPDGIACAIPSGRLCPGNPFIKLHTRSYIIAIIAVDNGTRFRGA
jgi:hypothetical protein